MELVYSMGEVLNAGKYARLKALDAHVFPGCGNEFKDNREWWVVTDRRKIIAYCGCLYSEGICIFVRAWVHRQYRGRGLQREMIHQRLTSAKKKKCSTAITYTTIDNHPSANNLIRCGFTLYAPAYAYAGRVLYWRKRI